MDQGNVERTADIWRMLLICLFVMVDNLQFNKSARLSLFSGTAWTVGRLLMMVANKSVALNIPRVVGGMSGRLKRQDIAKVPITRGNVTLSLILTRPGHSLPSECPVAYGPDIRDWEVV